VPNNSPLLLCHFAVLLCHFAALLCHFAVLLCHFAVLLCHFAVLLCHFAVLLCHFAVLLCYSAALLCHCPLFLRHSALLLLPHPSSPSFLPRIPPWFRVRFWRFPLRYERGISKNTRGTIAYVWGRVSSQRSSFRKGIRGY
jgi:hypothetical protein